MQNTDTAAESGPKDAGVSFPMSFAQQRLWMIDQYEAGTPAYNFPALWRLRGQLNVRALESSINEIVRRHESLRTNFSAAHEPPCQRVWSARRLPVDFVDLVGAPDPEAAASVLLQQQSALPFDLARDALMRVSCVRLRLHEHILFLNVHHIVFDGWSLELFMRELSRLYAAYSAERSPVGAGADTACLGELPIQYADYAAWERQELSGSALEERVGYWRRFLEGAPPALGLPFDAAQSQAGQRADAVALRFDDALVSALESYARASRSTPFVVLATALSVLLSRYSREDDVCLGYVVANRLRPELEDLIGFFANTLVLRTRISEKASFADLLQQVRGNLLEADAVQDTPFDRVVDAVQPERIAGRTPLFQVMLAFNNTESSPLALNGLEVEALEPSVPAPKFALNFNVRHSAHGLSGRVEYDAGLFDRSTVERLVRHLQNLLANLLAQPATPVMSVPVLSEEERRALLAIDVHEPLARDNRRLHEIFEQQAARTPHAVAVTCDADRLSYAELDAQANRLARQIMELRGERATPVAVCVQRSLQTVVAILGVLKADSAYVPIDPAVPALRMRHLLADSGVEVVLADSSTRAKIADACAGAALADELRIIDLDDSDVRAAIARRSAGTIRRGVARVSSSDPAYVIYTSGSTGRPKGCAITHANAVRLFQATEADFRFGPDDVWTLFHSIAFDFSVWEIWGALLYGGRLVVVPYWVSRSADAFHELLYRERVTVLNQTPTFFAHLIAADKEQERNLSEHLRYVIFGGEALDFRALGPWVHRHGLRNPQLINMYGITETTVHVTLHEISEVDIERGRSVIGRPLRDLRVYLLEPGGQLAPVGVPGEIYVAGGGVSAGYLNRHELTKERFVSLAERIGTPDQVYRSGDLARRLHDGTLEFLGRIDNQVKIRGYRIELGEIEAVLADSPQITRAAVIVRNQNGDNQLHAFLVPSDRSLGAECRDELIAEATRRVERHLPTHMMPAFISVIDALPLTVNGKLNAKELPAPDPLRHSGAPFVAPTSQVERSLAAIWCELLGLERISVHDNFFRLGGDSIIAIQVVARARKLGLCLTPRKLFEGQTISALATGVEQLPASGSNGENAAPSLAKVVGPQLLLPIQRWFLEQQSEPALHHFNYASVLPAPAGVTTQVCRQVSAMLLERHDALRLRFAHENSEWNASYAELDDELVEQSTQVIECGELPDAERAEAVLLHSKAVQTSLDLSRGPVFKIVWYDFGHGVPGKLLLVAHHMVVDGVSWRILVEDVTNAFGQLAAGVGVTVSGRSSSLQRWGELLQRYAASARLAAELPFWLEVLSGAKARLVPDAVVSDRVREHRRTHTIALSEQHTSDLLRRCHGAFQSQINDLLLSALALALADWASLDRVVLDLEGHGREALFDDVDLSQTVGWFTSKFPVALCVARCADGAPDVPATIRGVNAALRAIPTRGVGYGILRYLAQDPRLRVAERTAQIPICFNYLGQWSTKGERAEGALLVGDVESLVSPALKVLHQLELNGIVLAGALRFEIAYDAREFKGSSVVRFGDTLLAALLRVIEVCTATPVLARTPADFTLVRIDEATLGVLERSYAPLEDVLPASTMQQGMLFHSLTNDDGAYLVQYRYKLTGVQPKLWREAVSQVVRRHTILRTAFVPSDEFGFVQVVSAEARLPWQFVDLQEHPAEERAALTRALLVEHATNAFDPAKTPLFRCLFVQTGTDEAVFAFTFHHAILDGWSVSILAAEWRSLYEKLRQGRAPELKPASAYRLYVEWVLQQDAAEARAYWARVLTGFTPLPSLFDAVLPTPNAVPPRPGAVPPTAGAAPSTAGAVPPTSAFARQKVELSESDTRDLQRAANALAVTTNTLLQAAWALLLARQLDRTDVAFGVTTSGRRPDMAEMESIVGPVINTVPLRVSCASERGLGDWLREIALAQLEAEDYAFIGLSEIKRCCAQRARTPLFETLVVFENYAVAQPGGLAEAPWAMQPLGVKDETNYPLVVIATPGRRLALELVHNTARFQPPFVRHLAERLVDVLRTLCALPRRAPVAQILHRLGAPAAKMSERYVQGERS